MHTNKYGLATEVSETEELKRKGPKNVLVLCLEKLKRIIKTCSSLALGGTQKNNKKTYKHGSAAEAYTN